MRISSSMYTAAIRNVSFFLIKGLLIISCRGSTKNQKPSLVWAQAPIERQCSNAFAARGRGPSVRPRSAVPIINAIIALNLAPIIRPVRRVGHELDDPITGTDDDELLVATVTRLAVDLPNSAVLLVYRQRSAP